MNTKVNIFHMWTCSFSYLLSKLQILRRSPGQETDLQHIKVLDQAALTQWIQLHVKDTKGCCMEPLLYSTKNIMPTPRILE